MLANAHGLMHGPWGMSYAPLDSTYVIVCHTDWIGLDCYRCIDLARG